MNDNPLLRETLRALMKKEGIRPHTLGRKSGVPGPTISRFLSGKHKNLSMPSVQMLARYFRITDGQLLGYEPIKDLVVNRVVTQQPVDIRLTADERRYVAALRKLDTKSRSAIIAISNRLSELEANAQQKDEEPAQGDIFDALVRSEPEPELTTEQENVRTHRRKSARATA